MFFLSDREDSDDLYMGANMSVNEQITPFTPIKKKCFHNLQYCDSLTAAASYYCNYE